jgi:CubicO group peptidase (beta-lactamase class C family)
MNRRNVLQGGLALACGTRLLAAVQEDRWEEAAKILADAVEKGQVSAATLHVAHGETSFSRSFGKVKNADAMFLLGSISKPIAMTALMTLYDQGEFQLDDPLQKFLPKFIGDGRQRVTLRHVLTHVSGLPDQLTENNALRKKHAGLDEFVEHAMHTPLHFAPGSRYEYSSMAILLAAHVAERISGTDILSLVDRAVFQPLEMKHSAQGLGRFTLEDMIAVQTERAAPESGGGDPSAKEWDWNSPYWRKLGAPWGGTHASAPDIGRFLAEFLHAQGKVVKPETARLMVKNHNPAGLTPRGLGFNVGVGAGSKGCSEATFGHTGSTGTLCWADPRSQTICVVLTSLPGRAVQPHPRDLAGDRVAAST